MTFRVLFTSAGRRVGLLNCFRDAATDLGLSIEILACDLAPELSAACAIADQSFAVPRCDDPGYVKKLLEAVQRHGIHLIVPTIDPELLPLAKAADQFKALGARVHVSDVETVQIAQDKIRTAQTLGCSGVPVPQTFSLDEVHQRKQGLPWPLFLKPNSGSASRGLKLVDQYEDLPSLFSEPVLLQQHLQGPEYTVNIFLNSDGVLKSAVVHERLRVRAGEVEKGRTVRHEELLEISRRVALALPGARGVLCFQAIDDVEAGLQVFEINARFGGGYPLVHHSGANFARWLIEECAGLTPSAHDNWRDGVVMLRYDGAVFL